MIRRIAGIVFDLLLVALIAVGIFFRFNWTNWSEGTNLHPDEYGLTGNLTQLQLPTTVDEYFNTRLSPISPFQKYDEFGNPTTPGANNVFPYGQLPIVLLKWVAQVTDNTGYDQQRLLGRQMSAAADTLAVVIILIIGARLYNRRVGLMAAALSALAVMQIQQSHFMTADNFSTLFAALALWMAVEVSQTARPSAMDVRPSRSVWLFVILFGVFAAMAVASRINMAPLLGMIAVASGVYYWRTHPPAAFDWTKLAQVVLVHGLVAALAALVTFKLTQPMSFRAATGDTTLFTLTPNPDWLNALATWSAANSLDIVSPPAEQWVSRTPVVYPWLNMVIWGMGLPLGLTAWAGVLWALWRSVRSFERPGVRAPNSAEVRVTESDEPGSRATERPIDEAPVIDHAGDRAVGRAEWLVHAVPLVWVLGFFLFMGTRPVASIRYFLPIYPFLALFAAWAVGAAWQKMEDGRRKTETRGRLRSSVFRLASGALAVVVFAGTLAWAWGFTNIYRAGNSRVVAARWMYQNIPGPVNVGLARADGRVVNEPLPFLQGVVSGELPGVVPYVPREAGTVQSFGFGFARNQDDVRIPGIVEVVLSTDPNGLDPLARGNLVIDPAVIAGNERGASFTVQLTPVPVAADQVYYFVLRAVEGGPIRVTGSALTVENWDEPLPMPLDGRDPFGGLYDASAGQMEMHWPDGLDKRSMLLDRLQRVDYVLVQSQRRLWSASRIPATYPMTMAYYRALFDGRLGFELVAQFNNPFEIGPLRLSAAAGTAAWGQDPPLLPNWPNDPFNFNPLAAEEAFTVYDNAPVWIFRKTAAYSQANAEQILSAVDVSQVRVMTAAEASRAGRAQPTLMLPDDLLGLQRAGGTWSAMFDRASLLNTSQPLAVVVWYLAFLLLGVISLPVTVAALRGLPDGGYPFTRLVGLLIVTWLVWMAGSLRLLAFTQATIWLMVALLVGLNIAVAVWRRHDLIAYTRGRGHYLLAVEGLFLGLFLLFLFVRWNNPDLWHPSFGGEKPMDFSYFNAVLRSTYFPPYDPWFAGGYLNYYYYGFVLSGIPTKLLGVMPSLAYNLILPTWFALTGVAAFSVAFNLVAGKRATKRPNDRAIERPNDRSRKAPGTNGVGDPSLQLIEETEREPILEAAQAEGAVPSTATGVARSRPNTAPMAPALVPVTAGPTVSPDTRTDGRSGARAPLASPYLAGLAATLLMVVFGNLAAIRTYLVGFQRAADSGALTAVGWGDNEAALILNGLWRVASGQAQVPIGTGDWYWWPTRVLGMSGGGGQDFSEFPSFTFLYADPHAHLFALPVTVLVIAWGLAFVLASDSKRRTIDAGRRPASIVRRLASLIGPLFSITLGALALGSLRPTNTWDYPMYLAVTGVAIGGGQLWRYRGITGRMLLETGLTLVAMIALATLLYQPFDQWFVAAYSEVKRYEAETTTLEGFAYFFGFWVFVFASFIGVELVRWLRETPASVLGRVRQWLPAVVMFVVGVIATLAALLYFKVQVAWIAWPLLVLAGLLAFRGWERMSLQRRVGLFFIGTGMAVFLFVDLFTVGGDRMNTIFKLYMPLWTMFSVAGSAMLAWLWAERNRWSPTWSTGWTAVALVLVAGAALFTATAWPAKMRDRFPAYAANPAGCAPLAPGLAYEAGVAPVAQPRGLDGMDFLTFSGQCDFGAFLPFVYDDDIVTWLQDNVQGSPVIVEAHSYELYRSTSRIAWYTGLPNVVGWNYHQRQQRGPAGSDTEIFRRGGEIIAFYCAGVPADIQFANPTCSSALGLGGANLDETTASVSAFLAKYQPRYIIVGPLERALYPAEGLAKFAQMANAGTLRVVFENPGATIYEVVSTTR